MTAIRPYILYSLPISRTTQALTGGKIEKAWAGVKNFIEKCTNAEINKPDSIYLKAYTADEDHGEHPEMAAKIIKRTKEVFGEGETKPIGYLYPANTPMRQTETIWNLKAKDLEKALNHVIHLQPFPKYNLGPAELIISYDFKLIDLNKKNELPHQQYTSSILIWLTKRNCVSPSLCFPFSQPDRDFWNYFDNIEKMVPFKLDKKYLRLGRSNKKGTENIFSKL